MQNQQERRACSNCHYVGTPTMPGAGWIEAILWFCYLVPGLIYSVWRRGEARKTICPQCGAPNMLRLATPKGREIAKEAEGEEVGFIREEWGSVGPAKSSSSGEVKWFLLFILLLMFLQAVAFSLFPDAGGGTFELAFLVSICLTFAIRHFHKKKKADLPK